MENQLECADTRCVTTRLFERPTLYFKYKKCPLLGSFCPSPILPTPGQPCTAPGALDCPYLVDDECCCGQCEKIFSCVSDSTSGDGLWQLRPLCPEVGCGSQGKQWTGPVLQFYSMPQVLSPRPTTPKTILKISPGQTQYEWTKD